MLQHRGHHFSIHHHTRRRIPWARIALMLGTTLFIFSRVRRLRSVDEGQDGSHNEAVYATLATSQTPTYKKRLAAANAPKERAKPPQELRGYVALENLSELPSFTSGHEGYVLGATLTRDARLSTLLVDIFFMGRKVLEGGGSFQPLEQPTEEWARATKETMLTDIRDRENEGYICTMRLPHRFDEAAADISTEVKAVVVPTATTVDGNANDMVNIIRCEVPKGIRAFAETYRAGELQVQVSELVKESSIFKPMINFTLPIETRTTGYLDYKAPPLGTADFWKDTPDFLHMCIPGLRSTFKSPMPEMLVEFLEYHVQQGVDHFHFGVDYDWDSKDMKRFQAVVAPYMEEGRVTISSTTAVKGGTPDSECRKVFFFNQCLYHAKGMATWVGIWDTDELIVPRSPDRSIRDLIQQYADPVVNGGKQICFMLFTSYSHATPREEDPKHMWIGEKFADLRESWRDDGWQKSLMSTADTYFAGFHLPGTCTANGRDWSRLVRSDDPGWPDYVKRVSEGVAASFHFRGLWGRNGHVRSPSLEKSEYSQYYFDKVLAGLRARALDKVVRALKDSIRRIR